MVSVMFMFMGVVCMMCGEGEGGWCVCVVFGVGMYVFVGGEWVGVSFGMGCSLPGGAGHRRSHCPRGWCTDRSGCSV